MATDQKVTRKLRAILSADVKGYSTLMSNDEVSTIQTLKKYRNIMSEIIKDHSGNVVDMPGDNIMAEFSSVVNAVKSSVAIQKALKSKNDALPHDKRLEFRIGINIGDVVQDGDNLYGEGVNIAARIEGLADPGGICISRGAYDHIKNKLTLGYEYFGEHAVKNIKDPVRVYKILMAPEDAGKMIGERPKPSINKWVWTTVITASIVITSIFWQYYRNHPATTPAGGERMASLLPDRPSIAVLPFTNLSNDPNQEYFSDGISEDIITDLSKISGLIVISRNSSFAYKGKSVNAKQIGQELRTRYLLEGSVRKVGMQVRINAQLIDASKDQHLWAERYDGNMDNVFDLQDKITHKIISALALKLTLNEEKAVTDKGTDNIQAYDEFLKGWQGYRRFTKEGFAEAKNHLEKAVELDPEFTRAYAALAVLYWKAVDMASPELRQGLGLTSRAAKHAVQNKPQFLLKKAMKKPTALAHGLMSQFYIRRYQLDEALSEIERAVAMNPNDSELYAWMAHILWLLGKNNEAIESAKMALRLDPGNPSIYLLQLGKVRIPEGNLQKSLEDLERAKRLNPELSGSVALYESIIYGMQDRIKEAGSAYEIFLKSRMSPVRSLNHVLVYIPFSDPKRLDRIAESLIKAGVPGKPDDYAIIVKENLFTGKEVESLLFNRKITGIAMSTGKQVWWEWAGNGDFNFSMGTYKDTGKSWVEGNVFFIQFNKMFGGLPFGTTIFRNPNGSKETKNQYFMVSDIGTITQLAHTE